MLRFRSCGQATPVGLLAFTTTCCLVALFFDAREQLTDDYSHSQGFGSWMNLCLCHQPEFECARLQQV